MIVDMENKRKRIGIWIAAALIISVVGGLLWNGSRDVAYAREVFVETETLVQEKVNAGSTFTVLEIVSAQENARLGYLVGGCEPYLYDMKDTLLTEGIITEDATTTVDYPITRTGVETLEYDTKQPDLVAAGYTEKEVTVTVSSGDSMSDSDVSDGDESGNDTSGNDVSGNGTTTTTIYRYERDVFRNNEIFKKYVLGMTGDYSKLTVQVVTKTPAELTPADIESADLIYISGKNADAYASVQFKSDDVAKNLVNKITQGDSRIPCIIDYEIFEKIDATENGNLYRICLVLLSEFPESAYTSIAASWSEATDGTAWNPIIDTQVVGNNGHFVRENIYWYKYNAADYTNSKNPTGQTPCFVNNDMYSYFSATAVGSGFAEVVAAIDAENYNNSINYPGREAMNTNNITQALTVQYILKYNTNSNIVYKNTISVLEIQPCRDYEFDTAEGKAELISKWIPAFEKNPGAVTVTCMTISEFIGHNEDLNENYDMIYIGSNTGLFNTYTKSVTLGGVTEERTYRRFNDESMTGLLYHHVGDYGNVQYWGLIKTDYSYTDKTQYRFPGNDLTTYKLKELKAFLDGGSPIIVADDFFTYNAAGAVTANGTPVAINGGSEVFTGNDNEAVYGILDTSSYMYQLVVYAVHGIDVETGGSIVDTASRTINWNSRVYRNFFYESGANQDNLLSHINQQKLYLNLTTRPTEYSYKTTGTYGYIESSTYLKPASDGNYYLTYEFSISSLGVAAANQTYDCQLFIDINNDGKFSKTQEEMDTLKITEIATGNVVSRAADGYHLRAGVAYRMTRALPDEYMGCVAWELLCTASTNEDIHASETGYTVVKPVDEEKQLLKILQITSGYSTGTSPTGGLNSNNLNLQEELKQGTSVWGELLYNVPDFKLDITTIPTYGDDGLVAKFKADNSYLDNYDMLIFGFGDGFADIRYEPLLDAITDYANDGHCILFAHDTTFVQTSQLIGYYDYSRPNTTGGKQNYIDTTGNTAPFSDLVTYWGDYEGDQRPRFLTQLVRNLGGMDTYGVTLNGAARNGEEIAVGTVAWNELVASGKDIAYKPNTYQTVTVPNTQGATYIQLREWLRPGDDTGWWGALSNTLYTYNIYNNNIFKGLGTMDYSDGALYSSRGNANCNSIVEKVNDGMITNYPYKIADSFQTANTHGQYWALDIESDADNDGESDIVVWYTLEDYTTGDSYYTDDLCSISPKDVRNSYYIYNKGNITYTGVGHTAVSGEQEVKLFINTMVASYIASVKNPSVKIVEDGTTQASEISNITVPYTDGVVLSEEANNTVRVYFSVFDNNIVKGTKTITGNFYLDGTQIDLSIYSSSGTCLYTAGSGSATNVLNSGNIYYVEIPAARLAGHGSVDFSVEIYSDWVRNGEQIQSDKATDTVKITKVELFDLD